MRLLFVLLFILFNHISFSQQTSTVKGRVTDENGDPFPNINIFLPTSKTGTITNNDGRFSLTFSGNEAYLSISFIGYETQLVSIDKSAGFVNVQMKPSPLQLNEVVISNLSAAELLKRAIGKIPENYPLEPFLSKTYYRGQFSEADTLHYLEETAFDVIKSYRSSFSDKYYLIRNRNFRFTSTTGVLRGIAHFDVVKRIDRIFDPAFFRNYTVSYRPATTYEGRPVYVLSFSRKNRIKGDEGEIYIDVEDLAFVRFEINYGRGDRRFAQYRKIEDKYYLMNGNSVHLNKRLNRVFPAEGNMVTTNIIHSFSMDDIAGIPVETKDILETYATHAEDSLFWQEHSAILPDSVISRSIENFQHNNEVAIKDSLQYGAYLKRLYTPNISLVVSSGLMDDFSLLHYNSNSVNRYMTSLFQRNLRGILRQQLGIYFYTMFISTPVEEVMSEWMLLNRNGMDTKIHPFMINKYRASYLHGVDNQVLSDFKNENYGDFMRLHTVRSESRYVKTNMIEEELAKVDLSNKNNRFDYLQLYALELMNHRTLNMYNPSKKDMRVSGDNSDVGQPLIVDRNRSWVKYLFDPEAAYQRHVREADLTDQERKYLKRSSYWSWLNLVSPQMYGIAKFPLGNHNSFTFSLNYLRTPFGEQFGQNIWVMHNYSQLHGVFIKQYRNFEKTSFGIGYKLYDLRLFEKAYATTSLEFWQQPTDFHFMTSRSFSGFRIDQMFEYQFLPDKYVERNNFSLFLGYDYKTKGYTPESFFWDNNFNIKGGFKVTMK